MTETSVCQFDQYWRSDCRFRIQKLGPVQVKSKFDPCSSPPLLDMAVQVEQHTWKLSFVPSNRREARLLGLEYWPLRLHVSFVPTSNENSHIAQSILGCMESLKNGEELCFLNGTVGTNGNEPAPYAPCQFNDASTSWTVSIAVFSFLLTLLVLSFVAVSFVWWRRRNSSNIWYDDRRAVETRVPALPHAKPYIEDKPSMMANAASTGPSRTVLNPITEEDTSVDNSKNSSRWRESKLIQTSLPFLEAQQNLISVGSSRNSANANSQLKRLSPNTVTSDTEKLICSSSSESSV